MFGEVLLALFLLFSDLWGGGKLVEVVAGVGGHSLVQLITEASRCTESLLSF
jgi:hypothetical protein